MIKVVVFWAIVCFSYPWALIMITAGQPFDGLLVMLLASTLHLNSKSILLEAKND